MKKGAKRITRPIPNVWIINLLFIHFTFANKGILFTLPINHFFIMDHFLWDCRIHQSGNLG